MDLSTLPTLLLMLSTFWYVWGIAYVLASMFSTNRRGQWVGLIHVVLGIVFVFTSAGAPLTTAFVMTGVFGFLFVRGAVRSFRSPGSVPRSELWFWIGTVARCLVIGVAATLVELIWFPNIFGGELGLWSMTVVFLFRVVQLWRAEVRRGANPAARTTGAAK